MNLKVGKFLKNITKIINIIFCIVLPFSVLVAMFVPMAFDAPGSEKSFYTWVFVLSTVSIPVVILISVIVSFSLLKLKLYKEAIIFSLLPLINFSAILFAYWGIETFQKGRFSI